MHLRAIQKKPKMVKRDSKKKKKEAKKGKKPVKQAKETRIRAKRKQSTQSAQQFPTRSLSMSLDQAKSSPVWHYY